MILIKNWEFIDYDVDVSGDGEDAEGYFVTWVNGKRLYFTVSLNRGHGYVSESNFVGDDSSVMDQLQFEPEVLKKAIAIVVESVRDHNDDDDDQ